MLRLNAGERQEMAGYTAGNLPPKDLLARLYRQRDLVEPFVEVDSDGLTPAVGFDLVHRHQHADGGTIGAGPESRCECLPLARVQIRQGTTKAAALAALDAIRAAVSASNLLG